MPKRVDKPCEGCGTLMVNVPSTQKCCFDCRKKRDKEYQRGYRKARQEQRKVIRTTPILHTENPNKKYCKGCVYWGGDYENNFCCNYIFIEKHSRPCPPGKDCTEKIVGKRMLPRDFADELGW